MMEIKEKYFKENKLITVPKKEKNKIEMLKIILEIISKKRIKFTEKELNEEIKEIYSDYALIRRYLIDYKMISRDSYGKEYVLNGEISNE
ncbi:DUF2087 domain-containing protein [Gemella sanguinis]|uniref:DUF2087 domain-containing protein n=2 Tax=Gemella sanguinis TaxID=84135 RepID=A0A2N6SG53_9BACL|nr:DUF2087 domain-containing protein [Gemella sanguinis]